MDQTRVLNLGSLKKSCWQTSQNLWLGNCDGMCTCRTEGEDFVSLELCQKETQIKKLSGPELDEGVG